jgi:hypothetical protein
LRGATGHRDQHERDERAAEGCEPSRSHHSIPSSTSRR